MIIKTSSIPFTVTSDEISGFSDGIALIQLKDHKIYITFQYTNPQNTETLVFPYRILIEGNGEGEFMDGFSPGPTEIYLENHGEDLILDTVDAQFSFNNILFNNELSKTSRISGMLHFSDWKSVMQKAKRYLDEGRVQILNNEWQYDPESNSWQNHVTFHANGDTGEYDGELWRDDPNSNALTRWNCSCPWGQVSWGRTRKWRKYEGRPDAHTLAAHWLTQGTRPKEPPTEVGPMPPSPEPQMPPEGQMPQQPQIQEMPEPTQPEIPGMANTSQKPGGPQTQPLPTVMEQPQPNYMIKSMPQKPGQTPYGIPGAFSSVKKSETIAPPQFDFENYTVLDNDHISKIAATFNNGDSVRVKPGITLIGEDREGNSHQVSQGRKGEVIYCDETDCVVIFPLQGTQLTPHFVRVETSPDNLH